MIESHLGFHEYAWFLFELTPAFPWFMSVYGNETHWFKSVFTTPLYVVKRQGFHDYNTARFVCHILLDLIESYPPVHNSNFVNMLCLLLKNTMDSTVTAFTACQISLNLV
jgi:hypothetical protein